MTPSPFYKIYKKNRLFFRKTSLTWSSDLSSYVNLPLDALYYDFQYKFTPSFLFTIHFLWNACAISPPPVDWIGWSRMVETSLANTRQKHVLRICLNCEGVWLADKYWANVCMFCKLSIWDLAFTYLADTYLGFGKYMFGRVQVQQRSLWLGRFWWKGVISKWRFSQFSLLLDRYKCFWWAMKFGESRRSASLWATDY